MKILFNVALNVENLDHGFSWRTVVQANLLRRERHAMDSANYLQLVAQVQRTHWSRRTFEPLASPIYRA